MAHSRTVSPTVARFVARIYRVSLIRYVDVPRDAIRFGGTWLPVQASCNGAKFRGSLASRGGGAYRLALNATVRKAGGGVDEGDNVVISLRATSPHPVPPVPAVLAGALATRAGGRLAFEAWPPGRRRAVIDWLGQARSDATRRRRVQIILDRLGL